MPESKEIERQKLWETFDPNDPAVQILLLSQRVDTLCKEKETLEKRVKDDEARLEAIEKSLGKGAGILIGLATVGTVGGVVMAWGGKIFAPWIK